MNSISASRQLLRLSPREAALGASLCFLSGLEVFSARTTLKPSQFLLLTTFSPPNTFTPAPRSGEAGRLLLHPPKKFLPSLVGRG